MKVKEGRLTLPFFELIIQNGFGYRDYQRYYQLPLHYPHLFFII